MQMWFCFEHEFLRLLLHRFFIHHANLVLGTSWILKWVMLLNKGACQNPFVLLLPTYLFPCNLPVSMFSVIFQLLNGISFSWSTYLQPERIPDPIASQASMVWDWHRIMTIHSPPHILVLGLGHLWLPMITRVTVLCVSFIWHTKWYRSCSETCGVSWGSKIFQSANSQKFTEVKQSHDILNHATLCGQEMPRVWTGKFSLDWQI